MLRLVAPACRTVAALVLFASVRADPAAAQRPVAELAALFPPLPWEERDRVALPSRVLAFWQSSTGLGCVSIIVGPYPCAMAWRAGLGPDFSEEWRAEFIQRNGPNRRFANQSTAPRTGIAGEHLGAAPAGETLLGRTRQERRRSPLLRP